MPAGFDEPPEQRGRSLQVIVADRGREIVRRGPRPAHRGGGGGERGDPPRVSRRARRHAGVTFSPRTPRARADAPSGVSRRPRATHRAFDCPRRLRANPASPFPPPPPPPNRDPPSAQTASCLSVIVPTTRAGAAASSGLSRVVEPASVTHAERDTPQPTPPEASLRAEDELEVGHRARVHANAAVRVHVVRSRGRLQSGDDRGAVQVRERCAATAHRVSRASRQGARAGDRRARRCSTRWCPRSSCPRPTRDPRTPRARRGIPRAR